MGEAGYEHEGLGVWSPWLLAWGVLIDAGGELECLVKEGDGGEILDDAGCGYRGVSKGTMWL